MRINDRVALLFPLWITAVVLLAAAETGAMNFTAIDKMRDRLASHDPQVTDFDRELRAAADHSVTQSPWSVIDKKIVASSNDPRDYVSFGPYWWPDPAKPDGLPYIRRDGEVNPQSQTNSDHPAFHAMSSAVRTLVIAAYVTGEPKCAVRAGDLLRRFFLDPKTGMNPNLNFAQGIPGVVPGRGIGIIDVNSLPELLDSVTLLEKLSASEAWSQEDRKSFRNWCSQFLDWLSNSKNGLDESKELNNHGDWYDSTASGLADFLNQHDRVKQLALSTESRIEHQIKADGTLPRELARTKSWHYSLYALTAFATTAERARRAGIDLWHYHPQSADAGDLNSAVSYLLHYSETKLPWPKKDIGQPDDPTRFFLQVRALLDETRDADLCRRIDTFLSSNDRLAIGRELLLSPMQEAPQP